MERCWFAGVKCDMKAEGVRFKGGGGWTQGAWGLRWRRCGGGDLIGDVLWYCYASLSLKGLLFYCSVARLQWRHGVSWQHGGRTVQGTLERLKRWR
jgi:hypothetical protein